MFKNERSHATDSKKGFTRDFYYADTMENLSLLKARGVVTVAHFCLQFGQARRINVGRRNRLLRIVWIRVEATDDQ
jgi:hypothetical protein